MCLLDLSGIPPRPERLWLQVRVECLRLECDWNSSITLANEPLKILFFGRGIMFGHYYSLLFGDIFEGNSFSNFVL